MKSWFRRLSFLGTLAALMLSSSAHAAGVLEKQMLVCRTSDAQEFGVGTRLMSAVGLPDTWYASVFNERQLEIYEETRSFAGAEMEPLTGVLTYNGSYLRNVELRDAETNRLILPFIECRRVYFMSAIFGGWAKMLGNYIGN